MKWRNIKSNENNEVVFNPITLPQTEANLRAELGIDAGTLVLGRLARSDRSIYSSALLRAFREVSKNNQTVLVWVGASQKAIDSAKRLNVDKIIWVNPTKDAIEVAKLYNTFDVFCHFNALGETFGNTVAEAMLAGLPVVSLRGSCRYPQAQLELLGASGQYFKKRKRATERLKQLLSSADARSALGESNRVRAKRLFNSETLAKRVVAIYESVLSR